MTDQCYLREKCRGPKYHVCLAGKPDRFMEAMRRIGLVKMAKYGEGSKHQEAMDQRRVEHREQFAERDSKILAAYKDEGLSMNAITKKLKVSKDTVLRVLHEAKVAGKVEIRPQHDTRLVSA